MASHASRSVPAAIAGAARAAGDTALFLAGLLAFLLAGRTPRVSYHAMRRLYAPWNGGLNRLFLACARRLRPVPAPVAVDGFLGPMDAGDIAAIAAAIEAEGVALFPQRVPAQLCEALAAFAATTPCLAMGASAPAPFPHGSPAALRYDFSEQDILDNPAACRLVFDGTLAAIAAAYFGCRPLYDFSAMWWTTGQGRKDYSRAAQEFHFDMDRPFFLKFFLYLTDVDLQSGPHVYVAGSHRDKPRALREARRFDDAEVEAAYAPERILKICAPAGTLFAVDTVGLHKGLPVVSGQRLAFQIEFTISRFGQSYPEARVRPETLALAGLGPPDPRVFASVLPG
jgi:hypothetical protein